MPSRHSRTDRSVMVISLIVAMDEQGVIGVDGRLPWHLPADLKKFRELTLGKPVIMGRRTHESIGRPLPGRDNIIVSRDPGYRSAGCQVTQSLESALAACGEAEEVMIAGGAGMYGIALPMATRIYLTEVHARVIGDVHFPSFNRREWLEISREFLHPDDKNPHACSFVLLQRVAA